MALPGKVFLPSDPRYYALNKNRWSETAVLSPGCIVEAVQPKDVSVAIQILNADANEGATDCLFAVKSGGHTASPGANNILGGVSLDLGRLSGGSPFPNQGIYDSEPEEDGKTHTICFQTSSFQVEYVVRQGLVG